MADFQMKNERHFRERARGEPLLILVRPSRFPRAEILVPNSFPFGYSGVPNKNIVQNYLNIALLNVF